MPAPHKGGPPLCPTNPTINEEKLMRKALSAAVLVLTICCPVSAGVIHNPPPEPRPLLRGVLTGTADGKTNGTETNSPGWSDSLIQLTSDLLAVLPTLF